MLEMFDLTGKTAIVTGARKGLGFAIAEALAGAGADISAVGPLPMAELEQTITSMGRRFLFTKADLSSCAKNSEIIERTVSTLGSVDILVNNAGIIRRGDMLEFTEEDWDDVISLNLRTVFFLSQAAARQMKTQGRGGKIINICSLLTFQGGIRVPSYTASKSGLGGLTKQMANDLAQFGIQVNGIAPGYMATDNTGALRGDPERSQEILGRIPAGRWGTSRDIMGTSVYLASAASDYVTGHILVVDGGWLSR